MDQTIPGLLPEVTPRFNRFSTNQHNLLLRASAFWQQEQRNRNTGKQEHLKTGTSENRNNGKKEQWKTGTSQNINNGKQEHLKTGTSETRNTGKQENLKTETMENRNIWKQETMEDRNMWNRNIGKQDHLKTRTSENRNTAQEHLERIQIYLITGTIQSYLFMSAVFKELTLVSLAFQYCLIW